MVGYGLTLMVLPFFIERLALDAGATPRMVFIHVGALTGVFALMQFFFAPFWGKWSDRIGRRPLFLIGLGGNAFSNVFFGLGTSLPLLYAARILGGIISSAILPTVTAYVADLTSESERGKGMAWLGSATGLGVVAGPVLGAWLSELKWHLTFRFGHFYADAFSTPFFVAALLSLLTLSLALMMLPESSKVGGMLKAGLTLRRRKQQKRPPILDTQRKLFSEPLMGLFLLSFVGQFALSLFEGTFALHGQRVMRFGPAQLGAVFMVCGLVMALARGESGGMVNIPAGEGELLLPFGLGLNGDFIDSVNGGPVYGPHPDFGLLVCPGHGHLNSEYDHHGNPKCGKKSGKSPGLAERI